jgi:hypothetical protein
LGCQDQRRNHVVNVNKIACFVTVTMDDDRAMRSALLKKGRNDRSVGE